MCVCVCVRLLWFGLCLSSALWLRPLSLGGPHDHQRHLPLREMKEEEPALTFLLVAYRKRRGLLLPSSYWWGTGRGVACSYLLLIGGADVEAGEHDGASWPQADFGVGGAVVS